MNAVMSQHTYPAGNFGLYQQEPVQQAAFVLCACRQGYIEAGTLSRLLTQHTTADLYDRLKDLIDYLLLPGSVTKYLPARQQVPLLHASALDLHYQAAANSAVETMLLSTAFSNAEICRDIGTQRAAFFYLTMEPDSRNLVQVQVYAVGDSVLHSWKPPPNTVWDTEAAVTAAAATAQSQRQLLTLSSSAVALKLQESSSSRPSQFYNLVSSGGATKDCSTQLTSMVQSRLTTAVAAARATGIASSTVLQVCPIKVAATSEYRSHGSSNTRAVPVWVLYW